MWAFYGEVPREEIPALLLPYVGSLGLNPEADEKLFQALLGAADGAVENGGHRPYSSYPVGAAILTSAGKIASGANVENASYGGTVCAERNAIWTASAQGHLSLPDQHLAAVCVWTREPSKPCAFCIGVILEFLAPGQEYLAIVGIGENQTGLVQVVSVEALRRLIWNANDLRTGLGS